MLMNKKYLMLLGGLLLGGCALQPTPPPPPPVAETLQPADLALRQALALDRQLARLSPEAMSLWREQLQQLPASPETSVSLALLLARSGTDKDLAQAIALLEALQQAPAPEAAPWQELTRFLLDQYRRQAAQVAALQETLAQQAHQLRDSQRRYEQLSEKLEALKAIELSIPARPANPDVPLADRSLAP